jgi:hypothetical protein
MGESRIDGKTVAQLSLEELRKIREGSRVTRTISILAVLISFIALVVAIIK